MLRREELGFVDIATTMGSHARLVELAVKSRLPLIVQKPLAPGTQQTGVAAGLFNSSRRLALQARLRRSQRIRRAP